MKPLTTIGTVVEIDENGDARVEYCFPDWPVTMDAWVPNHLALNVGDKVQILISKLTENPR